MKNIILNFFLIKKMDKSHCFMNMEYLEGCEDFFDFSSLFEELEQEDNLTSKLTENKIVYYEVIRIEKNGNIVQEEGNLEEDLENNDNENEKKYRLYKFSHF